MGGVVKIWKSSEDIDLNAKKKKKIKKIEVIFDTILDTI